MVMDEDKLKIADAFFKEHLERIIDWSVGDIKKCCHMGSDGLIKENGSLVGAFILWCCAIEYFGGLLTGNSDKDKAQYRITDFVNRYLRRFGKYNAKKVYDLRWSLVHFYTPTGYEVLIHEPDNKNCHLKKSNAGNVIHLASSIFDLEKAVGAYKKDFWNKPDYRIRAFDYYKVVPAIKPLHPKHLVCSDEDCN